ncbi:MAG: LacI family transcriptional regulator [Firmicutes bacterium]|nr:LacI family transcriptional regulator [Bacillota bacterium]
MVTIKDVALRAGVSASTVSRALSGKIPVDPATRDRVLQAVEELGYRPNVIAQGLKFGRSQTIGLIIPSIRNLVFPDAVQGISQVARERGYNVILCDSEEDPELERELVDNLHRRLVDGLILSTARGNGEHIEALRKAGCPVVLLLRHLGASVDAVIADNYQGGQLAGNFLADQGFRKLAIVSGPRDLDLFQQRFQGFVDALKEADLVVPEPMIVQATSAWQESYKGMLALLDRGSVPEAVFATSDPQALGVMKAIRERGLRVPDDISVLGFDNLEHSSLMDPPLTTISQPFFEMGRRAAQRLFELQVAKKPLPPNVEKLPVELVVRDSVRITTETGVRV